MDPMPLDTLLLEALKSMAADEPELSAKLAHFNAAIELANQKDEHGNLTPAAHDARALLRNPVLTKMPIKRARRAAEKQARKAKNKLRESVANALRDYVKSEQYAIELELFDATNDGRPVDVPDSRESHDDAGDLRLAQPFIEAMKANGIAPSALGRLSALQRDLIAALIVSERRDPDFNDPSNLWVQMGEAGILDAFRHAMTPEQAKSVVAIKSLENPEGLERAELVRELTGLRPDFSLRFLLGVINLRDCLGTITDGAARAYSDALRLSRDSDVEALGRLLGMTDESEILRLRTLTNFIWQFRKSDQYNLALEVQVVAVKQAFERLEAHNRSPGEWSRDVVEMTASLAENLEGEVPGREAFEMLLESGFRLSSTHAAVSDLQKARAEATARDELERNVAMAIYSGRRFKVEGTYVFTDLDYVFEDIDGPIWDEKSWIEAHGPVRFPDGLLRRVVQVAEEAECTGETLDGDETAIDNGSSEFEEESHDARDPAAPDGPLFNFAAEKVSAADETDEGRSRSSLKRLSSTENTTIRDISEEDLR